MIRLLIGILLSYSIYSCDGSDGSLNAFVSPPCAKDDDCMADQVCEVGHCSYICRESSDCNPDEQCKYGEERKLSYCRRDRGAVLKIKQLMGKVISCMDFNTDLVGFTLSHGTFFGVLTAEECSGKCEHTKGCHYWTWVGGRFKPPEPVEDNAKEGGQPRYEPYTCMLKKHDLGRRGQKHLISGSKSCLKGRKN